MVDIALKVFIVGMSLLVIYWALQLLLGGSPTLDLFNIGITVALFGLFAKLNREFGEMKIHMKNGFGNVKDDMGSLQSDMGSLRSDMGALQSNMKTLQGDMHLIKEKLKIP